MSKAAAPQSAESSRPADPSQQPADPGQSASRPTVFPPQAIDADVPNPWGPDAPNVRDDDPKWGPIEPIAPPPGPPTGAPLDDDAYAPDEA